MNPQIAASRQQFLTDLSQYLSALLSEKHLTGRPEGLTIYEMEGMEMYLLPVDLSQLKINPSDGIPCMVLSLYLFKAHVGDFFVYAYINGKLIGVEVKDSAGKPTKAIEVRIARDNSIIHPKNVFRMVKIEYFPVPPVAFGSPKFISSGVLRWEGKTYKLNLFVM